MAILPDARFIALILLCAFVIDRIIASLIFAVSWLDAGSDKSNKGRERRREMRRALLYFLLSGTLAAAAMAMLQEMRLNLSAFGDSRIAQNILTWIILVAGAERVSKFVGLGSEASPVESASEGVEIRVAGTLRVDSDTAAQIHRAAAS